MIPPTAFEEALRRLIRQALEELSGASEGVADLEIPLEPPRQAAHGDLATSVALQLASRRKQPSLEVASAVAEKIQELLGGSELEGSVQQVEAKPPGFVNFTLSRAFLHAVLKQILEQGSDYGRGTLGSGKKAMVEFVSANPTGPLSVAHGRQAALGDALANLLAFVGYQVHREYYLNDEGTQIDLLGESILARAREKLGLPAQFPENGYKGAYVAETAARLIELHGSKNVERPDAAKVASAFGVKELMRIIRGELEMFGVRFDEWFPQSALQAVEYSDKKTFLDQTLDLLRKKGFLYESEGAWWLKSTAFGDDKDRVVIRSDGRLTYIAADIAYHRGKFERGFQLLVNLWGPDHHGYVARLKAAVQALGFPADSLQIRIVQLCTLKRGAETIPMSTREGQFITLTQVMEEVGTEAARFFFLLRKADAHLEFDLELAKKHSLDNPVYYIQYAHARVFNVFEHARKQGVAWHRAQAAHELLEAPEEMSLLRLLRRFPGVVEGCARSLEPFGMVAYLQELAEGLHRFYDVHRVVGSPPHLAAARLDLMAAVQTVLADGLRLLGVSAPEKL